MLRARVRAVAAAVRKAAVGVTDVSAMIPGPWRRVSGETYTGSWQQGVQPETPETLLAFAAVYGCVTLIAGDIAKLNLRLTALEQGVWVETSNPAYSPVLRKPNRYQTKSQFLMAWVVSKLLWGNTFVLKERDQRGVVVALYVLDGTSIKKWDADAAFMTASDKSRVFLAPHVADVERCSICENGAPLDLLHHAQHRLARVTAARAGGA